MKYYVSNIIACSDYYPFGMLMPGRNGGQNYRYNFQGQETDDEVKGKGNSVNYKYRMHDPRLGRFFAVDPLTKQFPFYSPYHFSGNKPIVPVELEGLEEIYYGVSFNKNGSAMMQVYNATKVNKDLDKAFQNVDPNNGLVNIGWDLLIIKTKKGFISGSTVQLYKNHLDYIISDINWVGNPYGDLEEYKDLITKIYNAPLKKVLIVIRVKDIGNYYASSGNWIPSGEASNTLTHEMRIHAIPFANGNDQPQTIQHYYYHFDHDVEKQFGKTINSPSSSKIRKEYPGSQAAFDIKATDETVKRFTDWNIRYMGRFPMIKAKPINSSNYSGGSKNKKSTPAKF